MIYLKMRIRKLKIKMKKNIKSQRLEATKKTYLLNNQTRFLTSKKSQKLAEMPY